MDTDILVAGETLVDFLPDSAGPLSTVETFHRRPGGAPANVAVALSELDHTPVFWTRVGDDAFGEMLVRTLDGHGLPTEYIERDPDARTTLAFVSHDEGGERSFSFYRHDTADTRIRSGTISDDVLVGVDHVVVGGVMLASGSAREATYDLMARGTDADCTVWFDPNARPELWHGADFQSSIAAALDRADVVTASPEDLAAAGFDDGDHGAMVEAVHEHGPHTVFLTLGCEGAYASATPAAPWDAATVRQDGYSVEAVDTTGAGDAFTAGALAAIAEGEPLDEAVAFANAVAAVTTTANGAMTALPDRAAVAAFRANQ